MAAHHATPPVLRASIPTDPPVPPGSGLLSPLWESHNLVLGGRRLLPSVTAINAYGDIDACNADALTEYTFAHVPRCRGLILDLRGVDFMGTEGFSALRAICTYCRLVGTDLAVVAGGAVSHLLQICDPEGAILVVDTVEALASLPEQLRTPLRLIANTDA